MKGLRRALSMGARPHHKLTKQQLFDQLRAASAGATEDLASLNSEVMERTFNYHDFREPILRKKEKRSAELMLADRPGVSDELKAAIKRGTDRLRREIEEDRAQAHGQAEFEQAISSDELDNFYRGMFGGALDPLLRSFREGRLFHAANYSFASFLEAEAEQRTEDVHKFEELREKAELALQTDSVEYKSAAAMYHFRISPSTTDRAKFLDKDRRVVNPDHLETDVAKEYWKWWRRYNRATVTYQWKDDSGVAYDARSFTQTNTEEDHAR